MGLGATVVLAGGFVLHGRPGRWRGGFVLRFSMAWRGLARFGGLRNVTWRDGDTEGTRVGSGDFGRAHSEPLQREAVMRDWDLARAAKAKKVGFQADFEGYFFIFRFGGGARAGAANSGCSSKVPDSRNRKRLLRHGAKKVVRDQN
jgi:hypothetical protein